MLFVKIGPPDRWNGAVRSAVQRLRQFEDRVWPPAELLHVQHETASGDLVLFRCAECGHTTLSLGSVHAHIERHRGYTRFNIQVPLTRTAMGDFDQLMERTEIVRVTEIDPVALEEVETL